MQASPRIEYNHALEYAILRANRLKKPVIGYFGLTERFPEANLRHYVFLLEGLREVQESLQKMGIQIVIRHQPPDIGAVELSKDASIVIVDKGDLKIQREWVRRASAHIECPLIQVETNVVVPVQEVSPKEEYAAATLRPKIMKMLFSYLLPLDRRYPAKSSLNIDFASFDITDFDRVISILKVNRDVPAVKGLHGGLKEAKKRLKSFLTVRLQDYPQLRNDPTRDYLSNMSPYLHFGQISPLYIALKVLDTKTASQTAKEAYLEELVVRRELSMNFVFYNPHYDSLDSLPDWAQQTLQDHSNDRREHLYTLKELENAGTHDPYWNAAQTEMMVKGKMHGYMRMYWGKKILEWTENPTEAYMIALSLNNKFELDGRDPKGFTGVAWCFGKHDRPWKERPIFGKVRYMSANGLERKFDIDQYVEKAANLNQ